MTLRTLRLSDEQIDELGRRRPSTTTLELLRAGQASRRRSLLFGLEQRVAVGAPDSLSDAAALLIRARAASPTAVDEVIGRPLAVPWAQRWLRQLESEPTTRSVPAASGQLRALAVSAAIRSGLSFAMNVPAPDGVLFLPEVGCAYDLHCREVTVRGARGEFSIVCPHATVPGSPGPHWRPRQAIALDDVTPWSIGLEDQDPDRGCFEYPPLSPLEPSSADAMGRLLTGAWRLIVHDHPEVARTARSFLRSVVPVMSDDGTAHSNQAVSASSELAFGCVAITPAVSPSTVSLLLVHELAHNLLDAAAYLARFCVEPAREMHHAPWRLDPRPVPALLQGAYAHAAVTEYWRTRSLRADGADRLAAFEFAYWRAVTTDATETLLRSAELTAAGRRLVTAMKEVADSWWLEQVSQPLRVGAERVAAANVVHWRILNCAPPAGLPELLGAAYAAGRPCPPLPPSEIRSADPEPVRHSAVAGSIRDLTLGTSTKDFAAGGADAYGHRIALNPDDDEAWVSLALTMVDTAAGAALARRPEIVRATLVAIRASESRGAAPRPDEIAAWIASAPTTPVTSQRQ